MFAVVRKNFITAQAVGSAVVVAAFWVILNKTGLSDTLEFPTVGGLVKDYGSLYLNSCSIYAGLMGFIFAVGSIFVSFDHGPRVKLLKNSPHYKQLFLSFLDSAAWLGVSAVLMVLLYIYTDPGHPPAFAFYIFVFCLVINLVKITQIMSFTRKIYLLNLA